MLSRIEAILGGAKRLRCQIGMDCHILIKEGTPLEAAKFLQKSLQVSDNNFARILGIG